MIVENITQEMKLQKPVSRYHTCYILMWISSWKWQSNPGKTESETRGSLLSKVHVLTIFMCLLLCFWTMFFKIFCCGSDISEWILETSTSHKCLNWCKTFNLQCKQLWDILGGPVAKNLFSQCRGRGFNPWSGNWIPHTTVKSTHATADPEGPKGGKEQAELTSSWKRKKLRLALSMSFGPCA